MELKSPFTTFSIAGKPELATLIRDWLRSHLDEFPSDVEVASIVLTLVERAASTWFRLAPLEKTQLVNREAFFAMVKAVFDGKSRGHLETRLEAQGPRHFLDGRLVNAGDLIEIELIDGTYAIGQYQWSFSDTEKPHISLADGRDLEIIPGAMLRWPARASGSAN